MTNLSRSARKRFTRPLMAIGLLGVGASLYLSPNSAEAIASCAPCFQSGCLTACSITEAGQTAAFTAIDSAISMSEQVLLESTGYGATGASGMIGFPALASSISASDANQTAVLVTAIEMAATAIASEIRKVPPNREVYEIAAKQGSISPSRARETCSAIDLGTTFNTGGKSKISVGRAWADKGVAIGGEASPAPLYPPVRNGDGSVNPRAVQVRLGDSGGELRLTNALNEILRPIREKALREGKGVTEILSAGLLIDDNHRTIARNTDDPLSDDQLSSLVLQLLGRSRPSQAEALRANATTPADLQAASEEDINDMRHSIPLAITERILKLRSAHDAKLGAEDYMKQAMGEVNPNELDLMPESDEGFMYLMANHRSRSSDWVDRIAVNSPLESCQDYATCQVVQTAAERLYVRYQTWLAKRDFNMALAQALSLKLEYEKP